MPPTPGSGEVLIEVEYAPIHPSELLMIRGLYAGAPVAHAEAIASAAAALYEPQHLPSARVLQALHSQRDGSYNGFV